MSTSQQPKLIARNAAALRRAADPGALSRAAAGNPISTRLESGVGNCFPGLECDLRNLERRFFPFLEVDFVENAILLAGVAMDDVAQASAAGVLSRSDAKVYAALGDDLAAGRSIFVATVTGTFGVLGDLSLALAVPALDGAPAVEGDLRQVSSGPGRKPSDAWTAARLLTEGTDVTLTFRRQGTTAVTPLTAKRARYLDDDGALSAAFLPGELSQSLCSPWTHDFRDCGCFYWASNHPDIVQPVLPTGATAGQRWNAPVPWERSGRVPGPTPPPPATEQRSTPVELRHYEINHRWQELHFVVGRRETVLPFSPASAQGVPLSNLAELLAILAYAAGVELAVAQEYLAAAYSLKPDTDPSIAGQPALRDDVRAARAEFMRIAIGEMRHVRAVNDVIRGLSPPGAMTPALRVATQIPHGHAGGFRPVQPRPATTAAVSDFIEIEAQSSGVDGLYTNVLATLESPPPDVAPLATDEWKQAVRSVIAEGEDHFQTFLDIQEWLSPHAEGDYLRAVAPVVPPPGDAAHADLQRAYTTLLQDLFLGYRKGRFAGSAEINAARSMMVGSGIAAKAEAVAGQGFLVVFDTPSDPRFAPIDPPAGLLV